jgi:hypothetical protein
MKRGEEGEQQREKSWQGGTSSEKEGQRAGRAVRACECVFMYAGRWHAAAELLNENCPCRPGSTHWGEEGCAALRYRTLPGEQGASRAALRRAAPRLATLQGTAASEEGHVELACSTRCVLRTVPLGGAGQGRAAVT